MRATEDFGKLVLRLSIGVLILLHGIQKIQHGIGGVEAGVVAKDLPEILAWGVYVGEVAAPALLIVGFFTRFAALAVVINFVAALYIAHVPDLEKVLETGGLGPAELAVAYLLAGLSLLFLGAGRFSIDGRSKTPSGP